MRILIADDHVMMRQGIRALLERSDFTVVGEASDGREALALATELRPDVAVLDFGMAVLNGIDAGREIMRASPSTRVVLLTAYDRDEYLVDALRAGITAYVLKSQAAPALVDAIREVARGNFYLSPGMSRGIVEAFLGQRAVTQDPLSARERHVLQLVVEGKASKEIAEQLGISVKRVEACRSSIMGKLNIRDIPGLVRYAIRRGILEP